ncbi:MAG: CPBP family intramembrane metalloprotease [Oscillospiraceae bacterium]|nr:CPBP family intramembrane metalloprotease [Oscillospiraceae bacterium]
MEPDTVDLKTARKTYSTIGIALTVLSVVTTVLQLLWFSIPGENSWMVSTSWGYWLGSFLPQYLVAMPLALLILKRIPGDAPAQQKLPGKAFFTIIPICLFMMYAGNLLGNLLSMLFSGGNAENPVMGYAMDNNPIKVVVMVILAPLFEELVCRKMVIDRTRQHGERSAVFLSALLFALMHQNLFQFFYAFGLGYLFAYIYLRTGRLHYTVLLHGFINLLGGVVAPFILSALDLDALMNMDAAMDPELLLTILPGLLVYLLYAFALMGLSVAGLVLLLVKRQNARWQEAPQPLPKEQRFKTVYLNVGMVVFILLCLASCVLALI